MFPNAINFPLALLAVFLLGLLVGLRKNLTATVRMIMRQAEAACPEEVEADEKKAEAPAPDADAPADEDKPRENSVGEPNGPVKTATPEQIAAARVIFKNNGNCMAEPLFGRCAECPFRDIDCRAWSLASTANMARSFLVSRGIPLIPEAQP